MAFACLHCGKTYGSSNAKTNHQRVCGLEKDLANEREENANLREELKQLRQELVKANSNKVVVQNINVFCFGSEPMLPEEVLNRIATKPSTAISEYVKEKHFSKPETKNIRISNKAKDLAQVVTAVDGTKKWLLQAKSEVVKGLLNTAVDELVSTDQDVFNRFSDRLDESREAPDRKKRKLYEEQIQSIERTIINFQ
jgi:hypothetical protein